MNKGLSDNNVSFVFSRFKLISSWLSRLSTAETEDMLNKMGDMIKIKNNLDLKFIFSTPNLKYVIYLEVIKYLLLDFKKREK